MSEGSATTLDPVQQSKLDIARQKKETGDQAFKNGDLKAALWSYHESLMYLRGLNTTATQATSGQEGSKNPEIEGLLEKIYANQSACHLKQQNWKRALETAEQALKKNEKNYKAMFRKGKALGELGYFEKCEKTLREVIEKSPEDAPGVEAELERLRVLEKERERVANQKFKGFLLNKEKSEKALGIDTPSAPAPAPQSASITEVVEETS